MSSHIVRRILLAVVLAQLFGGSASVTRSTTEDFSVNSEPVGAKVSLTRTDRKLASREIERNLPAGEVTAILADEDHEFHGPLTGTTPVSFSLERKRGVPGDYLIGRIYIPGGAGNA
jgi:hypothetical protein